MSFLTVCTTKNPCTFNLIRYLIIVFRSVYISGSSVTVSVMVKTEKQV